MLKLHDEAAHCIAQLQNLEIGTLTIAAHEFAALYLLPNAILHFLQLFPDVKVCVSSGRGSKKFLTWCSIARSRLAS
jgi:DNA-binding transcriptional LysR family regulator